MPILVLDTTKNSVPRHTQSSDEELLLTMTFELSHETLTFLLPIHRNRYNEGTPSDGSRSGTKHMMLRNGHAGDHVRINSL